MSDIVKRMVDCNGQVSYEGTLPVSGSVTALGPLTNAQLRATPVPVSLPDLPTLAQTYITSADMTTAAAITPAPAAGKKIVASGILVSTDTAMTFDIEMETSHNVLATLYLGVNDSKFIPMPIKGDVADKKLFGKASIAGNVSITAVTYSE